MQMAVHYLLARRRRLLHVCSLVMLLLSQKNAIARVPRRRSCRRLIPGVFSSSSNTEHLIQKKFPHVKHVFFVGEKHEPHLFFFFEKTSFIDKRISKGKTKNTKSKRKERRKSNKPNYLNNYRTL